MSSSRKESINVAHLHGLHLRFLSSAVKRMEADQSRLDEVSKSNVLVSRLMIPLFAEASLTSRSCGLSCAARAMAGRVSKERSGRRTSMVGKDKEEIRYVATEMHTI